MNIQTHLKRKALHAIKIFFLLFLFSSCKNEISTNEDDYKILNIILEKKKMNKFNDSLFLKKSNNNVYLINSIKNLNNQKSKNILTSFFGVNRNTDTIIFNKNEYKNYISQKTDSSYWNLDKIKSNKIYIFENKNGRLLRDRIIISKPIYSKDSKYSIVRVNNQFSEILVFKKIDNKWNEYKVFNVMIH